jgi:hypothetical protein
LVVQLAESVVRVLGKVLESHELPVRMELLIDAHNMIETLPRQYRLVDYIDVSSRLETMEFIRERR